MQSLTGTTANYSILIQPDKSAGTPLWWGTNLIPTSDFNIQPVGGQVITNLVPWGYTITVDGWPRGVHIVVPVSTNVQNVVSLINTNRFSPLTLYSLSMGTVLIGSNSAPVVETVGIDASGKLTTNPASIFVQYDGIDANGGYQFAEGNQNFFVGGAGNASDLLGNGAQNIAMGPGALTSAGTYDGNTAIGYNALDSMTTGGFNTALGFNVLFFAVSGNYNTAIGEDGGATFGQNASGFKYTGGESDDILIGNVGVSGESHVIRIGHDQTDTYLAGVAHANGSGLTNLNGANITGTLTNNTTGNAATSTLSTTSITSTNALNANLATNAVPGISLTNATVTGTVNANVAGSTNYQGYNLTGQIIQGNAAAFQTILTNASFTTYGAFANTNWYGYTISGNTYGGAMSLTNSPYFSIWSGYLSNYLVFGSVNTLVPYVDPGPSGAAYIPQGPSIRVKTQFTGQQLGMLSGGGGQFFWSSDALVGSPKVWTYTNLNNANIISSVFTWPNYGLHTLELNFVGCGLAGLFLPVTNSFVATQHPYETGMFVGDSIAGGVGTVSGNPGADSWAGVLQDKLMPLGISLVPQGEGGTGYVATNIVGSQITGLPIALRMTNVIWAFNPSFIVYEPSINDPTNLLYSSATNVFLRTKAALPNCIQLVIGTPPAITSAAGSEAPADLIMSNAAVACGLPFLAPEPSAVDSWVQGSYNIPNSGTAYQYYSGRNGGPGGPHMNPAGHFAYAMLSIDFIISHLTTNAVPIIW